MLFASWQVHMVKNCDRRLENAARGNRPRSQFFTTWTNLKLANNLFIFFLLNSKLVLQPITDGFVYIALSLNQKDVFKNKYFLIYFRLVTFTSPVKFSNIVFPVKNFVQSLKFYCKTISVSCCH